MPLFEVPRPFAAELAAYDSALRCRWSDVRQCYLIERKVSRGKLFPPPTPLDPDASDSMHTREEAEAYNREIHDEWVAACDGYAIVLNVDRDCLDSRVFFTLYETDIWRQGGADAVNERIDKAYWDAKRKSREDFGDFVAAQARERFRYMNRPRTLPESVAHTAPEGGMTING